MAKSSTDIAQLKEAGAGFHTAGADLKKCLSNIEQYVGEITNGGLEGKAQQKLISTYRTLSDELEKYPKKLNQIGDSLIQSAANEDAVDTAAEEAAKISM